MERKRLSYSLTQRNQDNDEDDPDKLYFRLEGGDSDDSDDDSFGGGDDGGGGEEDRERERDGNDWGLEDEDYDLMVEGGREGGGYRLPVHSYDLNPVGYVEPNSDSEDGEPEEERTDSGELIKTLKSISTTTFMTSTPGGGGEENIVFKGINGVEISEVDARFEWQKMLSNVLDGDVLKSEKTRLSTAALSTTILTSNNRSSLFLNNFENSEGKINKRQRAYAIWLLVRAKVRGTSTEEESRYIEEARDKVDDVINEVLKFKVVNLSSTTSPSIDPQTQFKNAQDQVASLLRRVDWCESLYPSNRALILEKERMAEPTLTTRLESLRTWSSITHRMELTISILKKWTGRDWETLSSPISIPTSGEETSSTTGEKLTFVEGIVREDTLEDTLQKRLLSDLHDLVHLARKAMIDLNSSFLSMNLPAFTSDLLRLAVFPSRLAQEALRYRLDSVANITDPSAVLTDQLTDALRRALWTSCEIKRQYLEIAQAGNDGGWEMPLNDGGEYDEILLSALRFFFKLLHFKLKNPSKAIYFKETEIVENEWGFLSGVTEMIDGGDLLVGEHFRLVFGPLFFLFVWEKELMGGK